MPKLRTEEDRVRGFEMAEKDYRDGQFLIESLGADRSVDRKQAITLRLLREVMINDLQIKSAAEYMLVDCAMLAYYNTIKAQRMLGDLVTQIERELFHGESMSVNLKNSGRLEVENFKVEAMLDRASDKLMKQIDDASKMMLRNVNALKDIKSGKLSIRADQVNIAQQQVNEFVKGNEDGPSRSWVKSISEDSSTDS